MSASDNAFIKIYKHEAETKTPRPVIAGGMHVGRRGITVSNDNLQVSQVVASAGSPAPLPDASNEPLTGSSARRLHAGQVDPRRNVPSQRWEATPSSRTDTVRRHGPHARTPSPHVDVARFKLGTAADGSSTENELVTGRVRPAWEVDRFRWPTVCDDLQRDWASPLTGIVRSVVREAWRGGNIVSVTQFGRFEGATTLALCLARIAASFHIRVVLVDGNAQNPDVGPSLGLKYDCGWETTGSHQPLEESAIGSLEDRLVILPLGALRSEESMMDDPACRLSMLERIANCFELVVLDAGPVFVAAHHWFSQPCVGRIGSALIVRDVRRTDTAQLDDVCCRLRGAGIANMSIVENFQFGESVR